MTKQPQDDAAGQEISEELRMDCTMAMRMALEADGAPARCPNRNCRRTGRCHVLAEDDLPVCQAGIPGHVAAEAALMLAFAYQFAEEVVLADLRRV